MRMRKRSAVRERNRKWKRFRDLPGRCWARSRRNRVTSKARTYLRICLRGGGEGGGRRNVVEQHPARPRPLSRRRDGQPIIDQPHNYDFGIGAERGGGGGEGGKEGRRERERERERKRESRKEKGPLIERRSDKSTRCLFLLTALTRFSFSGGTRTIRENSGKGRKGKR